MNIALIGATGLAGATVLLRVPAELALQSDSATVSVASRAAA